MKLGVLLSKNPLHTRISFCLNGVFQIENFQQGTQQLIQRFSSKDHEKYACDREVRNGEINTWDLDTDW
jgi:hypothetical protein